MSENAIFTFGGEWLGSGWLTNVICLLLRHGLFVSLIASRHSIIQRFSQCFTLISDVTIRVHLLWLLFRMCVCVSPPHDDHLSYDMWIVMKMVRLVVLPCLGIRVRRWNDRQGRSPAVIKCYGRSWVKGCHTLWVWVKDANDRHAVDLSEGCQVRENSGIGWWSIAKDRAAADRHETRRSVLRSLLFYIQRIIWHFNYVKVVFLVGATPTLSVTEKLLS